MKLIALSLLSLILGIAVSTVRAQPELSFVTQDFGPFQVDSDTGARGPAVEIVRRACEISRINCRVRLYPWRRALQLAHDAAVNGLFVIGRNPEREDWLYFSEPIIATEYGFFVPLNDTGNYERIDDFANLRVGVFGPSNTSRSLTQIAKKLGNLTMEMSPDDLDGFRKLNANRIQAVYSNKSVGMYIRQQLSLTNIRYAHSDRKLLYYIGFVRAVTPKTIVDDFNEALREMNMMGELQEILLRHNLTPAQLSISPKKLYTQAGGQQ
ncbi:substrate-binding periplasmic protein [Hahella ganghwensis]|uniref:substrate-binding periplasmic protein n=1 Tax=Hahella ganghwensis TaxID=286420 RepID=UPI000368EDC0|nr:transporter substrate-binding domain-containing protein [Hahella ganghwensis]